MIATRRTAVSAALVLTALATAAPSFSQATSVKEIAIPALHVIAVQQPKRIELANGMVIFLQEDHELPLIQGSLLIRGGERDEPADKVGLASLVGESWRTGGTKTKTGDELDELLSARAAAVETGSHEASMSLSFRSLKKDFDFVLPIFLDVLRSPAFRDEKLTLAKNQLNGAISRRNDDPGAIATRETAKLVYGPDSPYARSAEYGTVASITRDDLVKWHDRFVTPPNLILGVAGDFDSATMETKLRQVFGSWEKGGRAPAAPADLKPAASGVYFVPKNDVTQSTVYLVHPGTTKNNPDYVPLAVMNELFGGGFSSRLLNHVRTEKGLAYFVGGAVTTAWDHPGEFVMMLGTKSATTVEAIGVLRAEVEDLQKKPVSAEELRLTKDILLNSYVFTTDSKKKVLDQRMQLEFYGYPADFYDRYRQGIEKVTADDVTRVANKYIHPDQFALLVVGKEKDFDKPLASLGAVTTVDISIPEPGAAPKAATASAAAAAAPVAPAASNAEGLALVNKTREFVGGKTLDLVKGLRSTVTMTIKAPQGTMAIEGENVTEYPDREQDTLKTPMGQVTMTLTPDAAFIVIPGGVRDMPDSQRSGMASSLKADLETILLNVGNPRYRFVAAGHAKVGEVDTAVVEIDADGTKVKWFIDPATGRLLRKTQPARAPLTGDQITDYSEWKNFNGLTLPTKLVSTLNGEQISAVEMKTLEVNPNIEPKTWTKPQG